MRFFPFIVIAILATSCYEQQRNCTDFKTGVFKSEAFVGSQLVQSTFIRKDSIEIDIFEGVADTASVRWINDCEYIVKKLNPKNREEQRAVHIKIITTDKNSYVFEYNLVGSSKKERSTAVRIEEE